MRLRSVLTRSRTLVLLSVTALFVAAACLVAYATLASKPTHAPVADADKLEVELITLRPEGFEPLEIKRQKGSFVLLVDDRSGRENSSLQLQRLKGDRLRDLNTNRKKTEWYDVLNLPPGEYVLTDAVNPERRCQITIVP